MPRGLRGWETKHVKKFLREKSFAFCKQKDGSHEAWTGKVGGEDRVVNINVTHKSYPPKTLETMIRQSGIPKDEWRNWKK